MSNRMEALLGEDVLLGFRHVYGGALVDMQELVSVQVLDEAMNPIHTFAADEVHKVGLGAYQVTAPARLFPNPGRYFDVWRFRSALTSPVRSAMFEIQVVTHAQQAAPDFNELLSLTLADLDACRLKRHYLWPVRGAISNYYLPDSLLQYHLDVATAFVQQRLGVPLRQVRVMTRPFDEGLFPQPVKGRDYDEEGHLLQWSAIQGQWSTVRLPHSGIIRVNAVRGVYGGRTVYRIPQAWVTGNEFAGGFFRIRPTQAGVSHYLVDEGGQFLDWTLLEANGTTTVPGFWAVDYTYGLDEGRVPLNVADVVFKKAAVAILEQLGMEISRGIANRSASVDGLSSSVSLLANADRGMFGALSARYMEDTADPALVDLRRTVKGPTVFFI